MYEDILCVAQTCIGSLWSHADFMSCICIILSILVIRAMTRQHANLKGIVRFFFKVIGRGITCHNGGSLVEVKLNLRQVFRLHILRDHISECPGIDFL